MLNMMRMRLHFRISPLLYTEAQEVDLRLPDPLLSTRDPKVLCASHSKHYSTKHLLSRVGLIHKYCISVSDIHDNIFPPKSPRIGRVLTITLAAVAWPGDGDCISCTECSQVAGLIQKVGRNSSKAPSLHASVLCFKWICSNHAARTQQNVQFQPCSLILLVVILQFLFFL